MSRKSSSWHLSDPGTSRFRFFRSQIYRAFGSRRDWLRHRSQDDPSNQKQSRNPSLLPVQEKLGSSRVFLQTFPVEEASSFCSNPPPPPRERFRTIDAFHLEALHLSGLCNQSPSQIRRDLVFLSAKGIDRSDYPGAEGKLCLGQDSNQQFPSQPVLFPAIAIRLQPRQLVQETLPPSKISEGILRDHSDRILSPPGKIGENRPSEYTQITLRVYFQGNHGPYYPEYQKNGAIVNFDQLVKFPTNRHSEHPVF